MSPRYHVALASQLLGPQMIVQPATSDEGPGHRTPAAAIDDYEAAMRRRLEQDVALLRAAYPA